ncbi:MAG: DNA polymerase/3'-5' exonuclease PolX [Acidimicrobiia bacterium]
MKPSNEAIIAALRTLVAYTTLEDGQSQSFRTRAYGKAIDALSLRSDDVADLSLSELKAIDGIGDSTARKILEFVSNGSIDKVDRLKKRYPASMLELLRIPGLGPKGVLALQEHLGVTDVDGLRQAIEDEKLRSLPGMGIKSEEKIAAAIELLGLHSSEQRSSVADAMTVAVRVIAELERTGLASNIVYAGSLRRLSETIGDVDILAISESPVQVIDAFVNIAGVSAVLGSGTTKASVVVDDTMQVDLRVVDEAAYGAAMLYFTGNKGHNIELRQRALLSDMTLNEYALTAVSDGAMVAATTEQDIYESLGLPWITPEVREGAGEIAAALSGELPLPLQIEDIRGDLHVHTTWSGDGRSTMTEMLDALADRGLDYVALTDHAEDLSINGLTREQVELERDEIIGQRERLSDLEILHGVELNIGADGSIDYDPDFLATFDFGVASVHSYFDLDEGAQTERLLAAVQNPAVNVLGHPSGRKIGRRPGIRFNTDAVFEAAAETGTAIEINASLHRLDLSASQIRTAMTHQGLMVAISTDAHHTRDLENMRFGVAQARKGWTPVERVLNSLTKPEFRRFIAEKREF